jgi:hypothetical protein
MLEDQKELEKIKKNIERLFKNHDRLIEKENGFKQKIKADEEQIKKFTYVKWVSKGITVGGGVLSLSGSVLKGSLTSLENSQTGNLLSIINPAIGSSLTIVGSVVDFIASEKEKF